MSRITTSNNYYHEWDCGLRDCERRYCSEHRLLWRDCDTVKKGTEGDRDVIGGLHTIWELGDCPECERDERRKQNDRLVREWEERERFEKEHGHSSRFRMQGCPKCEEVKR